MLKASQYPIKKRLKLHGFDISVENPKGSSRHWKDPHSGESGTTVMKHDYGYFRRTEGTDGDHVDVYVGPDSESVSVFVIDQMKKPGFKTFDEQKVMLGFKDAKAAKAAYLAHYSDPRFFGSMKEMGLEEFRAKVLDKKNHGEKIATVLAHIAGPSGSGKTTLGNLLQQKHPHLQVKDLDEFDDQASAELFGSKRKKDYTDQDIQDLAARRQQLMDDYLKQHHAKPVVLVGHHTEGSTVLKLPTDNRWMLSTSATESARRALRRSQSEAPDHRRTEAELPFDIREAQDTIKQLRELGYEKRSPAQVVKAIQQHLGAPHTKIAEDIKPPIVGGQPHKPDPRVAREVKKSVESFLVSKGLPKDTPYALLAGASMYFHGMRPTLKDADIVVKGLGKRKFNEVHGKFEVDGGGNIDDLGKGLTKFTLDTRHQEHGVQFASLPATLAFKKALNRDKDQADIQAIQRQLGDYAMPFKSKRQQRAAFGGHIPGFSKEKAKEWAKETPDMKDLPERAPAEKGKPTLRSKKAELSHAHESGKGLSEAAIARGVKVELEHTKDPGAARQIAIDHLRERPDYYERLADAEKSPMPKKASLQKRSQAHTSYFVEMNLAKLAAGESVAPVLGEKRRSAGVGDNIPPQTDFAQAVEGDPVKAAADDRVSRISDRIDDAGIGLLAAPYAASAVGHGLAKSKNPKLRAAGAALERGLGTESRFGKSHGREIAGLAMVAPGVTHTVAKGINKALPKEKGAADQTVLSEHNDPPGYMMVQNLNRLTDQSKQLAKAVSVKDNAEPWVESKIDRASEAIDAVHDYMKYKTERPDPKHASVDLFLKMAKESGSPQPFDVRLEKRASLSVNLGLRAINAHVQRERERERDLLDAFYESQKHAGSYKLAHLEISLGFEKYAQLEKFASELYPDYEYMTEMEKVAIIGRIFNMFGRGAGAAGRGAAAAARGAGAVSKGVGTQVGHIRQGLAEGGKMFAQVPGEIGAGLRAGGQTFAEAGRGIAQSVGGAASNVAQTGRGALATAGDAAGRAQTAARLNFRAGQRGTTISPERIDLIHSRAKRLADFRAANPAIGPVQPTRMQRVGDQLSAMRQSIGDRFSALRQGASNQLGAAREGVANQFGAAREGIANRVSAAREGISNASQRVGDRMQALREGIGQRFSAAGQRIGEMGQGLREGAGNLAQAVRERVGGLGRITERQRAALGEQLGAFKQKTRDSLAAFRERGRAAARDTRHITATEAAAAAPRSTAGARAGAAGGAARAEQSLAAEGRAAGATGGAAAPAAASPAATPATVSGATPVAPAPATPAATSAPPVTAAATPAATPAPTTAATPAPATAPATAPAAAPAPPVTQAAAPAASPAATPAATGGATPVPAAAATEAAAAPAAAEAAAAEGAKKPGIFRQYGLPALGVAGVGLGVGGVMAAKGLQGLAAGGSEAHGPIAGPAYVGPGRAF